MRSRDLRALEFDKVLALVTALAVSEPGRRRVAAMAPATDPDEVRRRLRATSELVELRSHAGSLPIGEFKDQNPLFGVAAMEGATLDGKTLIDVRQFVLAARHLEAFLRSRCERFRAVAELVASLLAPKELADALLKALADDGDLLDDASRELKRLRMRLRDERAELEQRLARMLDQTGMQPFLSDHLVTIRNRRFVLPMKPNYAERLEGIVQDRSVSGETLFVEPLWAVGLNNRLMMIEREVEAEERRILAQLTAMVRSYLPQLRLTFEALVAIDALNARAVFAERYGCVEPEIVAEGITLAAARHPLLMASGRTVVPIEVNIPPDRRGIVISGPNTGGKTVALKTIGLLCLMAQSGLLTPAEHGSRLMVFRSIGADIGDEQSIEADLSTFSAHIANLAEILRELKEPALVILDEPGAGTDPAEGGALTIGLMKYLAAHRCLFAIATHSTAVKLYAYGSTELESAAVDFDEHSLTPRFTLRPHTVGQSFGLAVAERLGLPAEVVGAAQQARPAGSAELEDALRRLEAQRAELARQTEDMRVSEHQRQRAHLAAMQAAEEAAARASTEREKVRAEFRQMSAAFNREAARLLAELKSSRRPRAEIRQFIERAGAEVGQLAPEIISEPADTRPLSVGELVELADSDIQGELLALEPDKAVIGRGGLRIEVAPGRLRRARGRPKAALPATVTVSAPRGETGELNLIGMRAPDALRRLEEFLDQAYLTNQSEVRVIHGVGSGALRRAVRDYLSTSPYCTAYREAEPQAGGAGATIVQIGL
ncbi:MAG TPA: endonuclease MutS2 [Candidatus Binataceae bacterium]|nr:endonuclease MutS2 [Candidatus Binataceae bacterium]